MKKVKNVKPWIIKRRVVRRLEGIHLYGAFLLSGVIDLEIGWSEQHASIFMKVIRAILIDLDGVP